MAKLSELFPSKWLKACDLDEEGHAVTITKVEAEEFPGRNGKKETKPVLFFKEMEKGMVCNKTNSNTIGAMHGDDTDDWPDGRITIFPTEVLYEGKMTPSIAVKSRPPKEKKKTAPEPVAVASKPAEVAKPSDDEQDDDDDIPF